MRVIGSEVKETKTAKNTKKRVIMCTFVNMLKRRLVIGCARGHAIDKVNSGVKSTMPESLRCTGLGH